MRLMTILGLISVIACRTDKRFNFQNLKSKVGSSVQDDGGQDVDEGPVVDLEGLLPVVRIPAGIFTMGCTKEQGSDCNVNEKPEHRVIINRDFYLMKNEVTQLLYERVMGVNPSSTKGANRPVSNVNWYDAVQFCNDLSLIEGLEQCYTIDGLDVTWPNKYCEGYRLPTEAEWEYAARGGESFKYSGSDTIDEVGWDASNSEELQVVGQKKPNGYGLYDMSGNVWEWVWDWKGHYDTEYDTDMTTTKSERFRLLRGGSWLDSSSSLRVTYRYLYYADYEDHSVGLRLARSL